MHLQILSIYGVGQLSKDSVWNFYFAGITELFIPKNIHENNFDQLSKMARKELVNYPPTPTAMGWASGFIDLCFIAEV